LGVALLLGDYACAINAQQLEVFFFNLFVVAYNVPRGDYVDPKVFKYLWAPHVSQL
jgi:hypothetical protein